MPPKLAAKPDHRDRFVGFAFAAADLLTEIDAGRSVTFAAGAFREHFGAEPDAMLGRQVQDFIAAEDGAALELALSTLAARGRLPPVALHLSDAARTEVALSGLALPDRHGIAWLTFSRLPGRAREPTTLAAAPQMREALGQFAARGGGDVGLLEIGNWRDLHDIDRRALEAGLAGVMRDAGGTKALAASVAPGRFSVLGQDLDMAELQHSVLRMLQAAGVRGDVSAARIVLPGDGRDVDAQAAVRAMRFALSRFADSGVKGVHASGFSSGLRGFLAQAEADAASLRRAIEAQRFRLVFQPVVELSSLRLQHFEALLRPHAVVAPSLQGAESFVGFAEAMGMAELLDRAVIARAIDVLRGCDAAIAVNLSGLSLQNPHFAAYLQEVTRVPPGLTERLLIEITETAEIDDPATAASTVDMLAALGVRVCLDDFGAGSASFRYLRQFRVDYIKIDGSYVHQAQSGARDGGFVGPMVELARCAGASTIAEKVETEEQAKRMRDLGVQLGQGYLFGKPGGLPGAM